MHSRIDLVHAVGQDADGVESFFQGCLVAMDVYAVGQSAYYEGVGTDLLQVADECAAEVFSVGGDLPCAYHADNVLCVEVGGAAVV